MIRIILISLVISFQAFARVQDQEKNLNLSFENEPLRKVLKEIKNKSGINFIYNDNLVDKVNVTFSVENGSAENSIGKLLKKYGIAYRIFEENSYVLFKRVVSKEIKNIYKATLIEQPAADINPAVFIIKPKLISKMNPDYPPGAVRDNIEGKVNLKLLVTKEGNVAKTIIINSSGSPILDSAAVNHTYILKFIPAVENGEPVNVWVVMIFKYQITGKSSDEPYKN